MVTATVLDAEIKAFDAMLPKLRRTEGAVWAVMVGDQLKGTFDEFERAAMYAIEKFGDQEYLIRHTQEHTAHIPFIAVEA